MPPRYLTGLLCETLGVPVVTDGEPVIEETETDRAPLPKRRKLGRPPVRPRATASNAGGRVDDVGAVRELSQHPLQGVVPTQITESFLRVAMRYKRAGDTDHGRQFVIGVGAQSMPVAMQVVAFPHTVDIDMRNAMPTLVLQVLNRLVLRDMDILKDEVGTLYEVVHHRAYFCRQKLGMPDLIRKNGDFGDPAG